MAAFALARFILLEARRTRLPILVLFVLVAGIGLAGFLSQLALTESSSLQASVLAAFFRVSTVFLCGAFVVTSMVRESNDKGTELLLSLPISRSAYYFGKLAGFGACGALIAAFFSAVMLAWSPPSAVAAWFLSLAVEAWLVAAVSLFFVVTLRDVVPALSAAAGMYLLGRTITAIQAISNSPLASDDDPLRWLAVRSIDAVALLLPPLGGATQTDWLLYAPPAAAALAGILGKMLLYSVLASAAGLFDLHRRNL